MPKYQIIASILRDEIRNGQYASGQMLPTEEQLTERFAASRQTIRQALSLLVAEGLISKLRGSGSRVHGQNEPPRSGNIAVIATYISDYIFPRHPARGGVGSNRKQIYRNPCGNAQQRL